MADRCPNAIWAGTATLSDHVLRFRMHADVEPSPGHNVLGVLWLIDDDTLGCLDAYEGYPHHYDRSVATVWQDGEPILALVYRMVDQTYQDMPTPRYLELCRDGYQRSNVPTAQLDEAVEQVKRDPQWDPVFQRIKKTPERMFGEAVAKNEYDDLDR